MENLNLIQEAYQSIPATDVAHVEFYICVNQPSEACPDAVLQ